MAAFDSDEEDLAIILLLNDVVEWEEERRARKRRATLPCVLRRHERTQRKSSEVRYRQCGNDQLDPRFDIDIDRRCFMFTHSARFDR